MAPKRPFISYVIKKSAFLSLPLCYHSQKTITWDNVTPTSQFSLNRLAASEWMTSRSLSAVFLLSRKFCCAAASFSFFFFSNSDLLFNSCSRLCTHHLVQQQLSPISVFPWLIAPHKQILKYCVITCPTLLALPRTKCAALSSRRETSHNWV